MSLAPTNEDFSDTWRKTLRLKTPHVATYIKDPLVKKEMYVGNIFYVQVVFDYYKQA